MTNKEKLDLLAETFSLNADHLAEATQLSDLDVWDSMAKLSLIIMFVENFDRKLKVDEINKLQSLKDIMDMMEKV